MEDFKMAKYIVVNTSDVNALKTNARIYSAKGGAKHNGVLGQVGALKEGELELREFTPSTTEDIKDKLPMITVAPEVNYENDRRSQNAIGNFRYHADYAFTVVPMVAGDAIEVSADLIEDGEELEEGAIIKQVNGGGLAKADSIPESSEALAYFEVVGVRPAAIFQAPFGDGLATAQAPKMYTIELKLV